MEKPFSVKTLAEHWGCSSKHVYGLLSSGDLHGFRLGRNLWRISADEVRKYESENTQPVNQDTATKAEDSMMRDRLARAAIKGSMHSQGKP